MSARNLRPDAGLPLVDAQLNAIFAAAEARGVYATPVRSADWRIREVAIFCNGELAGTVFRPAKGGGLAIWTPERDRAARRKQDRIAPERAAAVDSADEAIRLIRAWSDRIFCEPKSRGYKSVEARNGARQGANRTDGQGALLPYRTAPVSHDEQERGGRRSARIRRCLAQERNIGGARPRYPGHEPAATSGCGRAGPVGGEQVFRAESPLAITAVSAVIMA
jgi:hypothetical protein